MDCRYPYNITFVHKFHFVYIVSTSLEHHPLYIFLYFYSLFGRIFQIYFFHFFGRCGPVRELVPLYHSPRHRHLHVFTFTLFSDVTSSVCVLFSTSLLFMPHFLQKSAMFILVVAYVVQNGRSGRQTTEGAGLGHSGPGTLSMHHNCVSDS